RLCLHICLWRPCLRVRDMRACLLRRLGSGGHIALDQIAQLLADPRLDYVLGRPARALRAAGVAVVWLSRAVFGAGLDGLPKPASAWRSPPGCSCVGSPPGLCT